MILQERPGVGPSGYVAVQHHSYGSNSVLMQDILCSAAFRCTFEYFIRIELLRPAHRRAVILSRVRHCDPQANGTTLATVGLQRRRAARNGKKLGLKAVGIMERNRGWWIRPKQTSGSFRAQEKLSRRARPGSANFHVCDRPRKLA